MSNAQQSFQRQMTSQRIARKSHPSTPLQTAIFAHHPTNKTELPHVLQFTRGNLCQKEVFVNIRVLLPDADQPAQGFALGLLRKSSMDVICPQCGTTYEFEESQIQSKSVKVKCSTCEHMFRVFKPTPSQILPALQTWIVRTVDGVVSHIPDQATLQRMIVERKVGRSDELSRDGFAWQLLGDVPDFQTFFLLVEQATGSGAMFQAVPDAHGSVPGLAAISHGHVAAPAHASEPITHDKSGFAGGAVLIAGTMDPGSTLEFGLPTGMPGISVQATESAAHKTEVGVEAASPERATSEPPPNEVTEVALEGVSPSNAHLPQAEDAKRVGSQEFAVRVSPPSSASFEAPIDAILREKEHLRSEFDLAPDSAEGEGADWFMENASGGTAPAAPAPAPSAANGQSTTLSFDDEPGDSVGIASPSLRDFSNYSGEFYAPSEDEDFVVKRSSRKGLWAFLIIVGVVLLGGGLLVLQPSMFGRLSVVLGLQETVTAAEQNIESARSLLGNFTQEAFKQAQEQLNQAEKTHGGPFPSSLASRIELELARTEYRLFQMYIAKQQSAFWKQKKAEIDDALMKLSTTTDSPEKTQKQQELDQKSKAYVAQIEAANQSLEATVKKYKEHWTAAMGYRNSLYSKDTKNLRTKLAELHLHSLSADAGVTFPSLYKKLLQQQTQPVTQTRLFLLSAWVALHQQQNTRALERLRKVISDQPDWVYPRLLQVRAWLAEKRIDDAKTQFAELLKRHERHPLVQSYQLYITQLSTAETPQPPPTTAANGTASNNPNPTRPPTSPTPAPTPTPSPTRPPARPSTPRTASGNGGSFQGYLRTANRLRRSEKYRNAKTYYMRALKIKKDSQAYSGLGWCELELSGPQKAIQHFQTALQANSGNPDAYFGLGLAYKRAQKNDRAKSYLRKFLSRFPRHRDAGEVRLILRSL